MKEDLYTVHQLNYQLQQGLIKHAFGSAQFDLDSTEQPVEAVKNVIEPKMTKNGVSNFVVRFLRLAP